MDPLVSSTETRTIKYSAVSTIVSPARTTSLQCLHINKEGLDDLHAFGSGIIDFDDFMPGYTGDISNVYVVNLIPRPLFYYNNHYLEWYGNSSLDKLLGTPVYSQLKLFLLKCRDRLKGKISSDSDQNRVRTEEEMVHSLGAHYFMPLTGEVKWPTDVSYVDDFITFCEKLPEDAVVYFHCSHGKGRTTTFLVLFDIFKNHKQNIPLEDIVNRHYCLGRQNLFDTSFRKNGTWTQEALNARKEFIVKFYDYMTSPEGYGHQSWSQWHKKQHFDTPPVKIHR